MRRLLRGAVGASLLIVTALVSGVVVPIPLSGSDSNMAVPARRILVLSNPIHTDIALPADADVLARFAGLNEAGFPLSDPALKWLVFGWGGRSFYLETPTWADLKLLPVMRALTVDSAVMHVELRAEIPADHPAVEVIGLSAAAFANLLDAVVASFDGPPLPIGDAGYGDFDRFYPAQGYFNALAGCNVWTAAMLRRAGVRTGWWTPLPTLLHASLWLHNPQLRR